MINKANGFNPAQWNAANSPVLTPQDRAARGPRDTFSLSSGDDRPAAMPPYPYWNNQSRISLPDPPMPSPPPPFHPDYTG